MTQDTAPERIWLHTSHNHISHEYDDAYPSAYVPERADLSPAVTVKPLEWECRSLNGYKRGRYAAKSPISSGWAAYILRVDGGWKYGVNVYSGVIDGLDVALDVAKMEAQSDYERRILSALTPTTGEREAVDVFIRTMKLSGNRTEHWVRIKCGNRKIDVRNYPGEYYNRALYERDELRHVLLGEPKPNLRDEQYADPVDTPTPPAAPEPTSEALAQKLWDEYLRVDNWVLQTQEGADGAKCAIRGVAVKLGVYSEFCDLGHDVPAVSEPATTADTVSSEKAATQPEPTVQEAARVLLDHRLPDGPVNAALVGHYGKRLGELGVNGVDLTVNDKNWTFNEGFRRMWRAALRALAEQGED